MIQLPVRDQVKAVLAASTKDYGALNDRYAAMRGLDKNFSPEEFLIGAKAAFEMVIDAFNAADHDTLKMLLSPDLYANFNETLEAQQSKNQKHQATLIAITQTEVTDAKLDGNVARMFVHFVSEQVILTRDADGAVVEGDPSSQQVVEDHWVFERTLTSADPAWTVVET